MRIERATRGDNAAWRALLAHAMVSFFGDGTCSHANQESSCFAAEWCENGEHPSQIQPARFLARLMRENLCYVALDDEDLLSGVIAVDAESGTVHSLCVPQRARGDHVGTRLLEHVLRTHGRHQTLRLTVARPQKRGGVLQSRYKSLLTFYARYGFTVMEVHDPGYTHMIRRRS
jgi:GNAT superfamily N-acetyltransferase